MNTQDAAKLNEESGKQLAHKQPKLAKNDSRYWLSRIFKPVNGRKEISPHYSMKIAFKGQRMAFSLGTGNKEAAARKARDIYTDLITIGTEATLARHRTQKKKEVPTEVTIGDWITAAEKVFAGKPSTFGGYARGLRFIASEILAVNKTKARYGRTQSKIYRLKVDAAPLSILTPEAIQAWRIGYVKKAGENPAHQRSARISCNSGIRQARALFSRKMLKFLAGLPAPDPLPFSGSEFFPRESMKYQSKIDASELLQSARAALAGSDPEAFKVLLLAIGAGLRRGEIDRLLWKQINFKLGVINIETTEAGGLKTEDSAGDVPIDPALVAHLKKAQQSARGQFVIQEGKGVTMSKPWGQRYRCADVFCRLNEWLRANGVNAAKPLHTLRKEAGSIIATKAGIHAASQFLRHADIQITAQHYAHHKERVTVDLSSLFQAPKAPKKPPNRKK